MWVHGLLWSLSAAHAAVPWPAEADWQPLTRGGSELTDPLDDHAALGDDAGDLLGTTNDSALAWDATADTLFLRLQVADSADYVAQDWGFLLELDGNDTTFEYALLVQGITHELVGWENASGGAGTWVSGLTPVDPAGYGQASTGETRTVHESGRFYVDVQLPRSLLLADLGAGDTTPLRVAGASAVTWVLGWEDVAPCDAGSSACVDLAPILSDAVWIDRDADGLTGAEESRLGTVDDDADTDDDGLLDAEDLDPLACDSDGDGLADGTEVGIDVAHADTDPAGCFVSDADPITTTDPGAADTDGGGLADGLEDPNHDGAIGLWETDPSDPGDDVDTDADGIPDVFDDLYGPGDDTDSDGDGLSDVDEGLVDTDGDLVPDFGDDDSDDDGLPDGLDGLDDTDEDGLPDLRDPDSDGDGIDDGIEGAGDTDGDKVPDFQDPDSDGDGIGDADEGAGDADGDEIPDFQDLDSDGDGIDDETEGAGDTDDDGLPDALDDDSDDDGIPDDVEGDTDTDFDGVPDFQDPDSDDDGVDDDDEPEGDSDCDGLPDRLDDDPEDGFCDTGLQTPPTGPGPDGDPDLGGDIDPLAQPGELTGGSCSVTPAGGALAPALLVLLALLAPKARAQQVNAQRLQPSVDGGALVKVEEATVGADGTGGAALLLGYADDPFVFRPADDQVDEVPILDAVATAHLLGHYVLGPLRVGAEVPVHLYTSGYGVDAPTHLGDLRLSTKARLLEPGPLALGLYADLGLPTGTQDAWIGAGEALVSGGALATVTEGRLLASASLGVRSGTGAELGDLVVTPAARWGLGAAVTVTDALSVAAEVDAEHWLANGGQRGANPVEALLSARQRFGSAAALVGAGTGLTSGVGAPDFRLVAGVQWAPSRATPEPVAEEEPVARGRLVVRVHGPDGQPVDGAQVRIPGVYGMPLKAGADGILEAHMPAGEYEVVATAPGHRTATRALALQADSVHDVTLSLHPDKVLVDTERGRIYLKDKVFFQLDRAELEVASLKTLDELAEVLLANEDIEQLRIEGHTDATGSDDHNLELSQQRAEAVLDYLVGQGVARDRLEAVGLGEGRPLQPGDSDEVHATNRRVELHIVSRR